MKPPTAALVLALAPLTAAQDLGRGSLGFDGREPRLELVSASPGNDMRFAVTELAPGGGPVILLLAAAPARIPLDGLGLKGSVLGLDPGSLVVTGPFPLDATGNLDLRVRVDPAWAGLSLFVQALHADARLRPPYALSDARSFTIGSPDPELVVARATTMPTLTDPMRFFPDGRPGTPLPLLHGSQLLDLDLAALDESRAFRPDLPRPVTIGGRRAVVLPDGSSLLLYAQPGLARGGLLRVFPSGRIEIVHEDAAGNVLPVVTAGQGHVAFATMTPSRLLLYRTDGANWPQSTEAVRDVTPPASLVVAAEQSVFGSQVLAYVDRFQGVFLIPLAPGTTLRPRLPDSGGKTPAVFDEEIGISGDGRSFVLGAGSDRKIKDVFVVRDDGRAINVSRKPTDYAEVGYTNPGRRLDMALNHDGSLVSWIDDGGQEPEGYVSKVDLPAPVHVTTSQAFVDSIDIGATTRFPIGGGGLVIAGVTETSLDVFFSPALASNDVVPLTKTGTATAPPWAKDSKLALLDLAALRGAPQYLLWAKHAAKADAELLAIDAAARTARVVSGRYAGLGLPLSGTRVVAGDGDLVAIADPTDTTAGFVTRVPLATGQVVRALAVDASNGRVAVLAGASAASLDLWLVDTGSPPKATNVTQAPAALGALRAGHVPGQVHLLSAPGSTGRTLLRWRANDGLASVGGSDLLWFLQP